MWLDGRQEKPQVTEARWSWQVWHPVFNLQSWSELVLIPVRLPFHHSKSSVDLVVLVFSMIALRKLFNQ